MNCDKVFNVLTRGPFPTGDPSDRRVEAHLTRCAACRRLAEALRPAIELFEEAVTPEESRNLPGYRGELVTAIEPAIFCAEPVEAMHHRPRPSATLAEPATGWSLWRFAVAVAFGVTLGSAVRWAGTTNESLNLPAAAATTISGDHMIPPPHGTAFSGQTPAAPKMSPACLSQSCSDCHRSQSKDDAAPTNVSPTELFVPSK